MTFKVITILIFIHLHSISYNLKVQCCSNFFFNLMGIIFNIMGIIFNLMRIIFIFNKFIGNNYDDAGLKNEFLISLIRIRSVLYIFSVRNHYVTRVKGHFTTFDIKIILWTWSESEGSIYLKMVLMHLKLCIICRHTGVSGCKMYIYICG